MHLCGTCITDPFLDYINALILVNYMLHGMTSRIIPPEPPDPTPVKRARLEVIGPVKTGGTGAKPAIVVQPMAPATQVVAPTPEKVQKIQEIIRQRFRRALRLNDGTKMCRCIESGYRPTTSEWFHIIGKMHVATASKCVKQMSHLDNGCLNAAIKRQHRMLFKDVLQRVDSVKGVRMDELMVVSAIYLEGCLKKGLDPNTPLKNKRLPLEYACAHSRIAHLEMLLKDERISVSQTVCRFVIRQPMQQRFAKRAIELCKDIVPTMILEAIVANSTSALVAIMNKLEDAYQSSESWEELTHMLMCPILNDYSTDIVKTTNNHYFDRTSLLTWVHSKHTDPLTREPLEERDLQTRTEFIKEYALAVQAIIKKL